MKKGRPIDPEKSCGLKLIADTLHLDAAAAHGSKAKLSLADVRRLVAYINKSKQPTLENDLLQLRNEINCRREHGAAGSVHLLYIEQRLSTLIKQYGTDQQQAGPASYDQVKRKDLPECKGCPSIWGNSNCKICHVWLKAHSPWPPPDGVSRFLNAMCPNCKADAESITLTEMDLEYAFQGTSRHYDFLLRRPAKCVCGWKGKGADIVAHL